MSVFLLLVLPMLCADRAVENATRTLNAHQIWPVRIGCMQASDGYACAAVSTEGKAYLLRCAGDRREACSFKAAKE